MSHLGVSQSIILASAEEQVCPWKDYSVNLASLSVNCKKLTSRSTMSSFSEMNEIIFLFFPYHLYRCYDIDVLPFIGQMFC